MFEFFFKYPASVFSRGTLVFAGGWPLWLLGIAILAVGIGLAAMLTEMLNAEVASHYQFRPVSVPMQYPWTWPN